MAKNKKEVLKASRKIIDKAAAAGVSIAAMAKVIQRLDSLQKDRDVLESKLLKNSGDAKVVWKALRAELKGLEAELEGPQQAKKTVTEATPKVSAPEAVASKASPKMAAPKVAPKAVSKAVVTKAAATSAGSTRAPAKAPAAKKNPPKA